MAATYLDSSAIVKLVVEEAESTALRTYLRRRRPFVSSALARTEVLRALVPAGDEAVAVGRRTLARLDLVRISDRVLSTAATLPPEALRSLDAIHLATVAHLGRDLGVVVTYDDRMAVAARLQGHRVASPR
ncbi:MAG: type II toxin-antitoxin system VapC family toxin [Acidimicrobiales bacterium]